MELDKVDGLREKFSAVVDGELHAAEMARALDALEGDAALRQAVHADWQAYHLIGDVLRRGEQAACGSSSRFLERLQARLQDEPPLVPDLPVPALVQRPVQADAANDGSFRWKAVAGFASLAAVVAVAWNMSTDAGGTDRAQLAGVPAAVVQTAAAPAPAAAPASHAVEQPVTLASGEPQVMIRDARLDELLAAHKQAGGGAALQMPAGFMRSATFAAPGR